VGKDDWVSLAILVVILAAVGLVVWAFGNLATP
jgi:hypothetical protein